MNRVQNCMVCLALSALACACGGKAVTKTTNVPPASRPVAQEATQEQILQGLHTFRASIPFAPADLNPRRLAGRLRRTYVPMWLVDGGVGAHWQAELGYDYDVVSYQDRFSDTAGWESHEVTETRVRWEQRVGQLSRAYQNIPAPALEGFGLWRERLGGASMGWVGVGMVRSRSKVRQSQFGLLKTM